MASAAAEAASMNRATIQTGDTNSAAAAAKAMMYAMAAMDASDDAAAQSAAAAATSDVTVAVAAMVAAEAAQATAEEAMEMAETYGAMAEAGAMTELMIDGKTKSVGDSTLTIDSLGTVETPSANKYWVPVKALVDHRSGRYQRYGRFPSHQYHDRSGQDSQHRRGVRLDG